MLEISIIISILCLIFSFLMKMESSKYLTETRIVPGLRYKVGGKLYEVPKLELIGVSYLLKEKFMLKIRKLYTDIYNFFEEKGIEAWVSGGTLLGFVRHKTFMPWDDDIDMHTSSENRVMMFSKEFRKELNSRGIETLLMAGSNGERTFYKGGLRLRFSGSRNPVMDIFFVDRSSRKTRKIENWKGMNVEYNKKEVWDTGDVFPINKTKIDDLNVNLPNNPEKVLSAQYGNDFGEKMFCQGAPHYLAYDLLNIIWNY